MLKKKSFLLFLSCFSLSILGLTSTGYCADRAAEDKQSTVAPAFKWLTIDEQISAFSPQLETRDYTGIIVYAGQFIWDAIHKEANSTLPQMFRDDALQNLPQLLQECAQESQGKPAPIFCENLGKLISKIARLDDRDIITSHPRGSQFLPFLTSYGNASLNKDGFYCPLFLEDPELSIETMNRIFFEQNMHLIPFSFNRNISAHGGLIRDPFTMTGHDLAHADFVTEEQKEPKQEAYIKFLRELDAKEHQGSPLFKRGLFTLWHEHLHFTTNIVKKGEEFNIHALRDIVESVQKTAKATIQQCRDKHGTQLDNALNTYQKLTDTNENIAFTLQATQSGTRFTKYDKDPSLDDYLFFFDDLLALYAEALGFEDIANSSNPYDRFMKADTLLSSFWSQFMDEAVKVSNRSFLPEIDSQYDIEEYETFKPYYALKPLIEKSLELTQMSQKYFDREDVFRIMRNNSSQGSFVRFMKGTIPVLEKTLQEEVNKETLMLILMEFKTKVKTESRSLLFIRDNSQWGRLKNLYLES